MSRSARLGDALRRSLLVAGALAGALGVLGAIIALAADRDVSSTIAAVYYIVGCVLFLIGMFPSGGFSLRRGRMTERRPLGSRLEPNALAGVLLVALGVVADITRPI